MSTTEPNPGLYNGYENQYSHKDSKIIYKVTDPGLEYLYLSFTAEKDCVVVMRASILPLANKLALFRFLGLRRYSALSN